MQRAASGSLDCSGIRTVDTFACQGAAVVKANRNRISARLEARLAEAVKRAKQLPSGSPIRRRLRERGLLCCESDVIKWLLDEERAQMLIDEVLGEEVA